MVGSRFDFLESFAFKHQSYIIYSSSYITLVSSSHCFIHAMYVTEIHLKRILILLSQIAVYVHKAFHVNCPSARRASPKSCYF